MTTYFENLYKHIFENNANEYTHLRIISGYASASFLSHVINDFPHLKIDLFLGMSCQGVSKNNHIQYISLVETKENINVFYQVKGQPNHMKILEFSTETSKKVFVGSANFSENGFFNHREVMTEINSLPAYLIENQLKDSLLCTNEDINDLIDFYDEELPEHNSTDDNINTNSNQIAVVDNSNSSGKRETQHFKKRKWELLKSKIDPRYYEKFEVTVVLPSQNNPRWASKGINSWVDGKNPVLEQTPKLSFSKVFPDETFSIYSDDNKLLKAKLTGNFQGQLEILNLDLYDYMRERIGLLEKRPISYEDLKINGYEIMYFIRLNQNEYQIHFNNN